MPYTTPKDQPEPVCAEPASPPVERRDWTADVALVLVAIMWGVNIPIMKHGVELIDKLAFNSIRLTFSAVVLGVLAWLENKPSRPDAQWVRIIGVVFVSGFIYQLCFVLGVGETRAGNTALILSTTPMWTALLAWLAGLERLPAIAWAGLVVTFMGTILVAVDPTQLDFGSRYFAGNMTILLASFLWALGAVLSKPLLEQISPTRMAFLAATVTLPFHYLIAGGKTLDGLRIMSSDPMATACVAYSGLFSTGLAYAFWNYGVRKVGPSQASIYQNLVPMIAITAGWFVLREAITPVQIPGGILILGGLLIMRRGRAKPDAGK